jgi:hypothetical protein
MIDHVGAQVADVEPSLVWPAYHPGYYGVFLRDLDGHNMEAVCHGGHDAHG